MKRKRATPVLLAAAAAILALALAGGPAAAKPSDGTRSFHGTVSSVAKNNRALTIDRTSGSQVRFVVRTSTVYEHVSGLAGLSKGTPVEVHAFRSNDHWTASRVEANPGDSGGHRGDDPPGDDHGGGHGADDPPGDDHGSGGHGSDD